MPVPDPPPRPTGTPAGDCGALPTPWELLKRNRPTLVHRPEALLPTFFNHAPLLGTILFYAAVHTSDEQLFLAYLLAATGGCRLPTPVDEPSGLRMEFALNVVLARGWAAAAELMCVALTAVGPRTATVRAPRVLCPLWVCLSLSSHGVRLSLGLLARAAPAGCGST